MKKILALIGVFLMVISCEPETEETKMHLELLPVESVVMPTEFYANTNNDIIIKFFRPTSCHGFDGFYYEKDGLTRTVAIQSVVIEQDNCTNLTDQGLEKVLQFEPTETGTYLFKFWKGKDTNGDDIFEEISVDVQ
ncbi:hypothetical protein [Flavobacterium terrigena]|uniref:Uncharacterized protein n=1 Tax=Flavobacterium terrigena TaxID=402734 RepID=A0A1H6TWJ3_9FLAO|nr:hypothetical protein [Flavobacterium terrigena]SEI80585.1 hypothetical protein SAMN05660918_1683 [Flavobacterium terrigena]